MSNDFMFNPLAYDEQVVAEKLGLQDYAPNDSLDVNVNLKLALLKEELAQSQRQVKRLKANQQPKRETFTSGGCGCSEGLCSKSKSEDDSVLSLFNDKKILTFLVIVLATFCVLQYWSYKETIDMMCKFSRLANLPNPTPNTTPNPTPTSQPIA